MNVTSITLDKGIKKRLDVLKAHRRESYNDVIARVLARKSESRLDTEGLIETVEVLSDPQIMRSLARSLGQLRRGKLYSLDEV